MSVEKIQGAKVSAKEPKAAVASLKQDALSNLAGKPEPKPGQISMVSGSDQAAGGVTVHSFASKGNNTPAGDLFASLVGKACDTLFGEDKNPASEQTLTSLTSENLFQMMHKMVDSGVLELPPSLDFKKKTADDLKKVWSGHMALSGTESDLKTAITNACHLPGVKAALSEIGAARGGTGATSAMDKTIGMIDKRNNDPGGLLI